MKENEDKDIEISQAEYEAEQRLKAEKAEDSRKQLKAILFILLPFMIIMLVCAFFFINSLENRKISNLLFLFIDNV